MKPTPEDLSLAYYLVGSDPERQAQAAEAIRAHVNAERARLRDELTLATAKLDRLRSLPRFAELLVAHGIVQEAAVRDSHGYDHGETLDRIAGAHAEIWASL
jgi:hypothetical protein